MIHEVMANSTRLLFQGVRCSLLVSYLVLMLIDFYLDLRVSL